MQIFLILKLSFLVEGGDLAHGGIFSFVLIKLGLVLMHFGDVFTDHFDDFVVVQVLLELVLDVLEGLFVDLGCEGSVFLKEQFLHGWVWVGYSFLL